MSNDNSNNTPPMGGVFAYGAPSVPDINRWPEDYGIGTAETIVYPAPMPTKKLCISIKVADDGTIHTIVSIDGVLVTQTSFKGEILKIEEDI